MKRVTDNMSFEKIYTDGDEMFMIKSFTANEKFLNGTTTLENIITKSTIETETEFFFKKFKEI